jgi:hypothetical protein
MGAPGTPMSDLTKTGDSLYANEKWTTSEITEFFDKHLGQS